MPKLENLEIDIDVDAVLRGQGADPAIMRARRPALVQIAEEALRDGFPLVEPQVIYKELHVQKVIHENVLLEEGGKFSGKLIVQHLAKAQRVYAIICTVGTTIEEYAAEIWNESATLSLAIDGVGSAAVEALSNAACRYFELKEQEHGWQTSIPLSPGMIDWSVEDGQKEIFQVFNGDYLPVTLTPSMVMLPRKSLTTIIGAGPDLEITGRICDYCAMRDTCRYQEHN